MGETRRVKGGWITDEVAWYHSELSTDLGRYCATQLKQLDLQFSTHMDWPQLFKYSIVRMCIKAGVGPWRSYALLPSPCSTRVFHDIDRVNH